VRYLSLEEILILHDYQLSTFGGAAGVLDVALLESAVLRPQTTFNGKDLYPTIFDKVAVLAISIIKNHPFVDGNKRTGLHTALVFLELNGVKTTFSEEELVKLGLDIANDVVKMQGVSKLFEKYSNSD
jgi:death on curing protein